MTAMPTKKCKVRYALKCQPKKQPEKAGRVGAVGKDHAVTLVPVHEMLSTQQAADILNVSRPFLISLLEKGDIPHTTVGRHRRIKAEHLFDY
jgi:excisionase family DNA binding protein